MTDERKKCLWKKVTEIDNAKRKRGDNNITLAKTAECYRCDGFNYSCKRYYSKNEK